MAGRRRVSVNALMRKALERMANDERLEALRRGYDALGSDAAEAAEADVEPFLPAQAELARRR